MQEKIKDDTISRQAAIEATLTMFNAWYGRSLKRDNEIRARFSVLPSAQPEKRWIPCSERLPESKTAYYIVTLESRDQICVLPNDIDIARWDYDRRKGKDSWHWCKEKKVIAWMPLPDPYRKEGECE